MSFLEFLLGMVLALCSVVVGVSAWKDSGTFTGFFVCMAFSFLLAFGAFKVWGFIE